MESLEKTVEINFAFRGINSRIDIYSHNETVLYTPPPFDPLAAGLLTGYDIRPLDSPLDLSPKPWEMPEPWKPEPVKPFELEPIKPQFGLQDPKPFQYGYELDKKDQFHLHGPDETTLTFGTVERERKVIKEFNGYESSMIDYLLKKNDFDKFP